MFLGLRTVIYHTPDINSAKAWYSKVLNIAPYFDHACYVGFQVSGFELGLDPDNKQVTAGNSSTAYWGVDNIQTAYQHLLSLGAKPHQAPQDVGEGIMVACVQDPFGNMLGIIENPHFSLPAQ